MMKAKEREVTSKDIEAITNDVSQILYAEWAEPGAQGPGGSARIYMLDGDDLIRYIAYYPDYYELYNGVYTLIGYLSDKRWVIRKPPSEASLKMLNDAIKEGRIPKYCFQSVYGGFGNYGWLNTGAGLSLDDNLQGLIFQHNGMSYFIKSTGYSRIKRQLFQDLEVFECECDCDHSRDQLSPEEQDILRCRRDALKAQLANVKEFTAR